MRRIALAARLAARDFGHDWRIVLCQVLGLTAVLAPLLVLFGMRFGLIDTLAQRLIEDPRNREIVPAGSGRFDAGVLPRPGRAGWGRLHRAGDPLDRRQLHPAAQGGWRRTPPVRRRAAAVGAGRPAARRQRAAGRGCGRARPPARRQPRRGRRRPAHRRDHPAARRPSRGARLALAVSGITDAADRAGRRPAGAARPPHRHRGLAGRLRRRRPGLDRRAAADRETVCSRGSASMPARSTTSARSRRGSRNAASRSAPLRPRSRRCSCWTATSASPSG